MNRFTHQVVIVTGGGQGLGAAMAHRFAAEGGTVIIGDVNQDAAADRQPSSARKPDGPRKAPAST